MEGTIGEIRGFGGNFPPRAWAYCNGQLMSIAQNQALFSILGTTYGGDGRTTFALPDLRGRVPISEGTGPGLTPRKLGSRSGVETVILNDLQMPSHTHFATATGSGGTGSITGAASAKMSISSDSNDNGTDGSDGILGMADSSLYAPITAENAALNIGAIEVDTSGLGVNVSNLKVAVTNSNTGGSQPHGNMQPYLTIHWVICLQGTFPSRN